MNIAIIKSVILAPIIVKTILNSFNEHKSIGMFANWH